MSDKPEPRFPILLNLLDSTRIGWPEWVAIHHVLNENAKLNEVGSFKDMKTAPRYKDTRLILLLDGRKEMMPPSLGDWAGFSIICVPDENTSGWFTHHPNPIYIPETAVIGWRSV